MHLPRFAALIVASGVLLAAAPRAAAQRIAPYADPPFGSSCTFHHFDEGEAPPPEGIPDDPLCVDYDKRDITASDGGAIRFLAAEPARFAAAIPKCQYWQTDHWSVQVTQNGTPRIVHWDGSYWFDKGNGTGAARLRNFAIDDQPAGPSQAANLIEPLDADLAAVIRQYGEGDGGGGGATICLGAPRDPTCPMPPPSGTCGDDFGDVCAVASARAAAAASCDCAGAPSHMAYVSCASQVADDQVAAGQLPARCTGDVVRCEARSTCGRAGAVTCCRTNARGTVRCAIKHDPGSCRAPRGGGACVGPRPSCCDACTPTGCA
jgi:hypothetical protein